ncbi:hypothetical protein GT037_002750 [Alternaria burnsii]|uniref:Uncharacterized protein n=1 Tax=Alternaria burnsii TaxID=1187904 RepID=A0A8H7B9K6_9PLEO|nr:uncharacterized protein GT037_002750 [Alternaria burnsii]KAF7679002.1 hypothetical protein GT037_002750 [Alternaria burnsii]CAI9631990.1 unnamed protein product [Alternaria burnsii]
MSSPDYNRKNLSNYKHLAEFMRDQEAIMNQEEERRRHEDEERYDEEESVMHTSFPESAVSQEHQVVYSELPLRGDTLTLPTLVQRQADTMHIISTGLHDREVFANMITYSYRTRSIPQLKTVTGELTHVLNTLYIRIDGLEKLNTELSDMLGNAHAALNLERQGGRRLSPSSTST